MKIAITDENGYTFLNTVDTMPTFGPLFQFKNQTTAKNKFKLSKYSSLSKETIKNRIKVVGGYLIELDTEYQTGDDIYEHLSQYSVKGLAAAKDYYFSKDWAAVVNSTGGESSITLDANHQDSVSEWPLLDFSLLTEDRYLSNPFNEMIGAPPANYCYVGKNLVQTCELSEFSIVKAKFYEFEQAELVGAFNFYEQELPWLPMPSSIVGAKKMNKVLTGKVKDGELFVKPEVFINGAEQKGVLLTSSIKAAVNSLRAKIASGDPTAALMDIKSMILPPPTYESVEGDLLVCYRTLNELQENSEVTGAVYKCNNMNFAQITADLIAEVQGFDAVNYDAIVSPHSLQRFVDDLNNKYTYYKNKYFELIADSIIGDSKAILNQADSFARESLTNLVKGATENIGSGFGADVAAGSNNALGSVVGVNFDYTPKVHINQEINETDKNQTGVQQNIARFGCDMKLERVREVSDENGSHFEVVEGQGELADGVFERPRLEFGSNIKQSITNSLSGTSDYLKNMLQGSLQYFLDKAANESLAEYSTDCEPTWRFFGKHSYAAGKTLFTTKLNSSNILVKSSGFSYDPKSGTVTGNLKLVVRPNDYTVHHWEGEQKRDLSAFLQHVRRLTVEHLTELNFIGASVGVDVTTSNYQDSFSNGNVVTGYRKLHKGSTTIDTFTSISSGLMFNDLLQWYCWKYGFYNKYPTGLLGANTLGYKPGQKRAWYYDVNVSFNFRVPSLARTNLETVPVDLNSVPGDFNLSEVGPELARKYAAYYIAKIMAEEGASIERLINTEKFAVISEVLSTLQVGDKFCDLRAFNTNTLHEIAEVLTQWGFTEAAEKVTLLIGQFHVGGGSSKITYYTMNSLTQAERVTDRNMYPVMLNMVEK